MTVKVLLDTDIGSDIDDAVCLAYLLAHPDCDLLGITTVSGEPIKRAQLASAICKVAGRDIPIFPGTEHPMLIPQRQLEAHQAPALERWDHQKEFPQKKAIDFMQATIRENPGEVILLSIGPLTNLGLLFVMDPEIASLLKGLVMMCGVYTNKLPGVGPLEWNAMLDPHATAIVFNQKIKIHRSIGLDVTCQVILSSKEVQEKFSSPLLAPVLDFAKVWFDKRDNIIFHDPLAAVTIFNDDVCEFDKGKVEVELLSPKLKGITVWTPDNWLKPDEDRPHEVAMKVDASLFFERYLSVF